MKALFTAIVILLLLVFVLPMLAVALNRVPLLVEPGFAARMQSYFTENQRMVREGHAFPELRPICVEADAERLEQAIDRAAKQLGWERVDSDHWVVTSAIFRFKDDVYVRIREGECRWLEIESNSRVGRGDLGANLSHILRFNEALRLQLKAGGQGASG
ncbi:MAG: DUF1499 domain-containing protein [Gammaproteobacteria bacterium]